MGHYFINDENLKSDIQEFLVEIKNEQFSFYTDNGVFSKGELDYGTSLLIETVIDKKINGKALDLGCGYGAIGIIINKLLNIPFTMVDINKRAVSLAQKNVIKNKCHDIEVLVSDGYENIHNKYDYIISNPPIRIGKKNLYLLIKEARNYLNPDGMIFLVIRKEQGAKSFIRDFSSLYKVDILTKSKNFYIISLKCY